jgi:predicted choloylglycine hydrolase
MLQRLTIAGSHYETGLALGQFGAQALHGFSQKSPLWSEVMRLRGSAGALALQRIVKTQQPEYWRELQGLADGLQMPLEDVFVWNCRGDLLAKTNDGCTTIARPWPEPLIAHNEDGDPLFAGQCALAHIKADSQLAFTAFVYPGSIPGHTFGVNAAGLCMTVNNLRPKHAGLGLPRMFVTRALISQPSLERALQYLRRVKRSGAFHLTLAQAGDERLLSIEFTSQRCSVVPVTQTTGHANHMIHDETRKLAQNVTDSSRMRQKRVWQCLADNPAIEPLEILFDTADRELPIFRRDPNDPDSENTLASARFEIGHAQVHWGVYEPGSRNLATEFVNERLAPQ